jgi:hypothetical protein
MSIFEDPSIHGPFAEMTGEELDARIEAVGKVILDDELERVAAGENPDDIAREYIDLFGDDQDLGF